MKYTFLIITFFSVVLIGCLSNTPPSTLPENTQYSISELEKEGLLQTTKTDFIQYRIIFPRIVKFEKPRKMVASFLQNLSEIQSFNNIGKDDQNIVPESIYVLDAYSYEQSYRNNIYSLSVELAQGYENKAKTYIWYTLNLLLSNNTILTFSDFFQLETYADALFVLTEYLRESLVEQKQRRNVDLSQDVFVTQEQALLEPLFENFTLLPHPQKSLYAGIRIFINQYVMGRKEEGAYIINISSFIFYEYLNKTGKVLFHEKGINFADTDPNSYYALYYPDIQRLR